MNKKKYIAPAIEVVEVEVTFMLAVSDEKPIGGNPETPPVEELSNGRRGEWGNLWADR